MMRLNWLCATLAALLAAPALAQRPGTTVQLPTYSYFGTATTVSVPDRGSAYLGGVNRAASGSNEFGTPLLKMPGFRNRAMGMERSAISSSMSVYIHDFQAMDEAILGGPASSITALTPRGSVAARGPGLEGLRAGVLPRSQEAGPPVPSLAEVRAAHAQEQKTRGDEAADFFRRGQDAEAAGKIGVAKIYYQMAARRAAGDFKQEVLARLEALKTPESSKLAHGTP